jgi:hypothetical protein
MKLPSKKIIIMTVEELEKKRFQLFDYIIYIPKSEFYKMSEQLNKSLVIQMNNFEFLEKEV